MKLPQLSLREVFLLVALVAIGCGWWVDRARLTETIRYGRSVQNAAFGYIYISEEYNEQLDKCPRWDPHMTVDPPVSPQRALAIAEAEADRKVIAPESMHRHLLLMNLKQVEDHWVWEIVFEWHPDGISTGLPHSLTFAVLMDGSAIEPTVYRRD
jgi:hypothetical protein